MSINPLRQSIRGRAFHRSDALHPLNLSYTGNGFGGKEKGQLIHGSSQCGVGKTFRSDKHHSHYVVYSHFECMATAMKKRKEEEGAHMSDAKLPPGCQGT